MWKASSGMIPRGSAVYQRVVPSLSVIGNAPCEYATSNVSGSKATERISGRFSWSKAPGARARETRGEGMSFRVVLARNLQPGATALVETPREYTRDDPVPGFACPGPSRL